ncbi:MAG TPA: hypothetical protein VIG30_16630, partial [Ktedonobacterales bacterium]
AHVLALGEAGALRTDDLVVINLSGRGDKDINTVADALGVRLDGPSGAASGAASGPTGEDEG